MWETQQLLLQECAFHDHGQWKAGRGRVARPWTSFYTYLPRVQLMNVRCTRSNLKFNYNVHTSLPQDNLRFMVPNSKRLTPLDCITLHCFVVRGLVRCLLEWWVGGLINCCVRVKIGLVNDRMKGQVGGFVCKSMI